LLRKSCVPDMVVDAQTTPSFVDAYGSTYRLIEPGSFVLGDPSASGHPSERPSCTVTISEPYFLAERPVTQAQWADVMGSNPSKFQEGWSAGLRPVEQVSLDQVEEFLDRLNARDHTTTRLGLVGTWRLPSETEWEYAARAGTTGRWWFGDKDIELDEHGWHAGNAGSSTREVGLKKANPWGFFDMNGLVSEWCADHWARNYDGGRTQHPHVDAGSDRFVVRGGSWFTESESTRNGARASAVRSKTSDGLGVRLVWAPLDSQPNQLQSASPSTGEQS
ncbi:MAG: formylglycine-generating enzyme family protein, partial [Candidatus Thermoplasmatota archaeon]|nr:formylglycine-generating enzyme family protein [Candidatus Thermoplasmatota archaeon]